MVKGISLGDGLVIGYQIQLIIQFDIMIQMRFSLVFLSTQNTDMGKNFVRIAFAHRIAFFHHFLTIKECRVGFADVIVDLAK